MSHPSSLLDFLYELATNLATRREFEADPQATVAARGLPPQAQRAMLTRQKSAIDFAVLAEISEGAR